MSAKTYRITRGSFVQPDGSTVNAGALIDLPDDVATEHAARLEPVDLDAATQPDGAEEPQA